MRRTGPELDAAGLREQGTPHARVVSVVERMSELPREGVDVGPHRDGLCCELQLAYLVGPPANRKKSEVKTTHTTHTHTQTRTQRERGVGLEGRCTFHAFSLAVCEEGAEAGAVHGFEEKEK